VRQQPKPLQLFLLALQLLVSLFAELDEILALPGFKVRAAHLRASSMASAIS
jgi:hypothetical protein